MTLIEFTFDACDANTHKKGGYVNAKGKSIENKKIYTREFDT